MQEEKMREVLTLKGEQNKQKYHSIRNQSAWKEAKKRSKI